MKAGKIKRLLLGSVFAIVIFGGVAFFILPPKGYIPVLMYHFVVPKAQVGSTSLDVSVENFSRQMWFLKTFGFRTISLDEYEAIKTGRTKAHGREVLITFDDGNETYIQYALPVLERYQINSANFLVWNFIVQKQYGSMSLEDAKRLSSHPLITFASHSLSHIPLADSPAEEVRTEIFESKAKLEEALGAKINYFCYPEGSHDERTIKMAEEAGYRLAFTTSRKQLQGRPGTLYSIVRIKVSPTQNLFVFWINVSGFTAWGKEIDSFFHQLTGQNYNGTLTPYKLNPKTS